MRRTIIVASLCVAGGLALAEAAGGCVRFSATRDWSTQSSAGVQLTVEAFNNCGKDLAGSEMRFVAKAYDASGRVIGRQHGRFPGTVAVSRSAKTQVLVHCDPTKAVRFDAAAPD